MKRFLSIAVSFILLISLLSGCGDNDENKREEATKQESTTAVSTTQVCEHDYVSSISKEATYEEEGEKIYHCRKCDDMYVEPIAKLVRKTIPTEVLDQTLSDVKYYSNPFSISLGRLVNAAMDGYKIEYQTGEEAISNGHLSASQFDSTVDINNVYFAIISGDTMMNPDIPYMTEYEKEAVKAYMIFDDNGVFQEAGVKLCENLETCAILIMTTSY